MMVFQNKFIIMTGGTAQVVGVIFCELEKRPLALFAHCFYAARRGKTFTITTEIFKRRPHKTIKFRNARPQETATKL